MNTLKINMNGKSTHTFELNKDQMFIGRKPHNDIVIDNRATSGKHCQIITIMNQSFLEDLNSTNGTFLNGVSVKKHALNDGDIIGVGRYQIKFHQGAMQSEPTHNDAVENAHETTQQHDAKSIRYQVNKLGDKLQQMEFNDGLCILGVAAQQSAAISVRPTGAYIVHLEGGPDKIMTNVNGIGVTYEPQILEHEDIIEVAGEEYQLIISS